MGESTMTVGEDLGDRADMSNVRVFPRLLVIDATRIGSTSATGQVKQKLLAGWPADRLMQVFASGDRFGVRSGHGAARHDVEGGEACRLAAAFAPDVVYVRPLADPAHFSELTWDLLADLSSVPVVVHIMDDWPRRLETEDPSRFAEVDKRLRDLLQRASVRMSISREMSRAYWRRYGVRFEDYANFIDGPEVLALRAAASDERGHDDPDHILFRYSGGLAADMSLRSLHDIAEVIEEAGPDSGIRMQIGVLPPWRGAPAATFADYELTTIHDAAESVEGYRRWLLGADACIIAYNFDQGTAAYTQYSMANKLPDCLAAGKPILAYGPSHFATLGRCLESGGAVVVGERDRSALTAAVLGLATNPQRRRQLGERGQHYGLGKLNAAIRRSFQQRLLDAAGWADVFRPFPAEVGLDLDEVALVNDLASTNGNATGSVLVDARNEAEVAQVVSRRVPAALVRAPDGSAGSIARAVDVLRTAGYAVWLSTWHPTTPPSWHGLSADLDDIAPSSAALAFLTAPSQRRLQDAVLHHLTPLPSHDATDPKLEAMNESKNPASAAKATPARKKVAAPKAPPKRRPLPSPPRSRIKQLVSLHTGIPGLPTMAAVVLLAVAFVLGLAGLWTAAGLLAILGAMAATVSVGAIALRVQSNGDRTMRRLRKDVAADVERRFRARDTAIHKRLKQLTAGQASLTTQLKREAARRATTHRRLRGAVLRLRDRTAEQSEQLERFPARQATEVERLEGRIAELHTVLAQVLESRAEADREVRRLRKEVRVRVDGLDKRVAGAAQSAKSAAAASKQAASAQPQVDQERLLPPSPFRERSTAFNAGFYQPFRRQLTNHHIAELANTWTEQLGCRMSRAEIGYLAHRVGVIEAASRGRLAKTIESTVLMMMVGRAGLENAAEQDRPFRVLEIGTLFGVGMALVFDACRDRGTPIELVAVDPLDGYYGTDVPDMITGVHVTKSVWEENLRTSGVSLDSVELHQVLSKDAYPEMADERFDLIIIDGDHTYDGVKVDGDACVDLLAPGGYLLFDDYGNPDWPDVQQYVDDTLLYRPGLQKVGAGFTTIVFRAVDA